jgi:hypothetical protein
MEKVKYVMSVGLILLFIVSIAYADPGVNQIADNALNPQISNGQVVWQHMDGNSRGIYLWDGNTVQTLTSNIGGYSIRDPQIDNGQVVWTSYADILMDQVYFWDGEEILELSDKGLNCSEDEGPQIDNGQVVWAGYNGEIYFVDSKANIYLQLTDNDYRDRNPRIDDGLVVWAGSMNNQYNKEEIFYWDFWGDRKVHQLTDNDIDDEHPQIHNRQVVWQGLEKGGDWEIYFWDGATIQQLTDNDYRDRDPQIDDGLVVWAGSEGNRYNKEDIYYWDFFGDQKAHQLTDNSIDDEHPQVHNGQVVWQGLERDGDWEIYFWDGATIQQLTENDFDDNYPKISNGQVVWEGYPDGPDSSGAIFGWGF